MEGRTLGMIRTEGLSISTDDFLAQARVPAHEGDVLTQSSIAAIVAVKSYDEHLAVIWLVPSGEPKLIDLNIVPRMHYGFDAGRVRPSAPAGPSAMARTAWATVSPRPSPFSQVQPDYTEEAKQAKLQGSVLLSVVVDETGKPT